MPARHATTGPMIDRPNSWDLPRLDDYVEAVLQRMADNRDVMRDASGAARYTVQAAGTRADGKLRIDLVADGSGIGLPSNTPMTATVDPEHGPIAWFLGDALIATTARDLTPEGAGDALGMERLLDAFRRWMGRGEGRGR